MMTTNVPIDDLKEDPTTMTASRNDSQTRAIYHSHRIGEVAIKSEK